MSELESAFDSGNSPCLTGVKCKLSMKDSCDESSTSTNTSSLQATEWGDEVGVGSGVYCFEALRFLVLRLTATVLLAAADFGFFSLDLFGEGKSISGERVRFCFD